ncbi:MAG: rRNA pseudouridine synthase, partial [Fibrobacter sp.]|nr:rRNA pseudouridine synthase [Fibrobacter sp.]
MEDGTVRLNRFLAQCGLGSRRKADELISGGNVFVNGKKIVELGMKINPAIDKVEYHGNVVKPFRALEYIAYYKPRNVVVTKNDPEKRETVYDALRKSGYEVDYLNYIGRLDFTSEGLLLLTNDGELIHALTHPRFHIKKVYMVKVD